MARRLRVSPRTLRHYETLGLLRPEAVDPANGYRSYGPAQLFVGVQIEQLKAAGLPLRDIGGVLDGTLDVETVLAGRRRELHAVAQAHARRLAQADALAAAGGALAGAALVDAPAVDVVSVCVTSPPEALAGTIRRHVQRLRRELRSTGPAGPWTFAARFPLDLASATVTLEIAALLPGPARPPGATAWAAATMVQSTLVGPLELLPLAYDAVLATVDHHGLTPTGEVRETYLALGPTPTTVVAVAVRPASPTATS